MKKIKVILITIIILSTSCKKNTHESIQNNTNVAIENNQIPTIPPEDAEFLIKFPSGSTIIESNQNVDVTLPSNYEFIYKDGNSIIASSQVTFTCKCTEGGCSPSKTTWGTYSCIKDTKVCKSTCDPSSSTPANPSVSLENYIIKRKNSTTTSNLTYINNLTHFTELRAANEIFINLPEVQNIILQEYNSIYPSGIPQFVNTLNNIPNSHGFQAVDIYGVLVYLLVPKSSVINGIMINSNITQDITCTCNSGSTGCTKKTYSSGRIICKAGACTSCSLDDSIILTNSGDIKAVTRLNGYINTIN